MNIEQLIDYLESYEPFRKNVAGWHTLPAQEAQYADFPADIDERLIGYLKEKGIERPYAHQRASFDLAAEGRDFVVVTPTASGKTLCYNLPVIDHIIKHPEARALYLFPTKALAQDQMHEAIRVVEASGAAIRTYTFDGDTPASARKAIREAGHIVITNPDMLHAGILPHHTIWVKLFENLKFIVIDELHSYRGVFGSHLCNLIRRLKRICAFYGSNPQFILCSATIANPAEHASRLIEREVALVDNNGAPRGKKHIVIYNPPVVNEQLGIRASSVKESASIATLFVQNKVPTIVFARSRLRAEVISTYLKERIKTGRIAAYRGGFLPTERREIERKLREGELDCVVSTNALELGIDIGMLDAVVTTGYPGSISSLLQQFGRAGRRGSSAIAVMTASSSALDQFIAENPRFITEANPERAIINPDNLLILMDHIKCAAFELPFSETERFAPHLSTTMEILDYLEENGIVKKAEGRYHWMSGIYPANEISLRSAAQENFVIIDTTDGSRVIGEIDYHGAPTMIHDDAIYLHQGRQFYVDHLDWERRQAKVHEVDSDYYTDAESKTDIHVLTDDASVPYRRFSIHRGEITIREQAVMFKKIKFNTHENLGWGKIALPEIEMHTTSLWIDFSAEFLESFGGKETAGLLSFALGYLVKNIAPLYLFCDPMDIRTVSMNRSSFSGNPALFIHDSNPGGSGLSARLFDILPLVLEESSKHLSRCRCSAGCPSCIGPLMGESSRVKEFVTLLINEVLGGYQEPAAAIH
jgi:DEAD/DEAH box helicase domain-containing protein